MSKFSMLVARLKDRLTTKVLVPCSAPGPCPICGAVVEVYMTRTPMQCTCTVCKTTSYTMGIGLVDVNIERLQYIHNMVIREVNKASIDYDKKLLH